MGRERVRLEATADVSRHNSPSDDVDNATWNAFVTEVRHLAGRQHFAHLRVEVSADECPTEAQWSGRGYDEGRAADG